MKFDTKCVHAAESPDPVTGAVMPPIYQTSTYAQEAPGRHKGFEYSRTDNPTRQIVERKMAALESGRFGVAFASGMAAIDTVMHLVHAGDHVIYCDDAYGGTHRLFQKVKTKAGLQFDAVDMTHLQNLRKALKKETRMVWLESPTNPLLKLIDIRAVSELAKEHGVLVVVDNTFMSPYFQNPLKHGADVVVHSTTKYLNGHSDVVGGAVVVNDKGLYEQLKFLQNAVGAIPGPFDCWLVLRGIKTLGLRMRQHEANALRIAEFLQSHKAVTRVIYPGLKSHPQHALAKKQMSGFGGMVTFEAVDGLNAEAFIRHLKVITCAESLGGVESLVEYPAVMTHASLPKEVREKLGISDHLLRLSVGIEDAEDLLADLDGAFATALM